MMENRMLAACLRSFAGLFGFAGVLALTACGGGSGAPNNPYAQGPAAPGPLTVQPPAITVYSGTPTTLTVTGGIPPYYAYSGNPSVLPVTQAVSGGTVLLLAANVAADVTFDITVQDSTGLSAKSGVTVSPAPLLNGLTVTPNDPTCGANAICSGQTGTAAVTVTGPAGGGIPNRQVRFDVVSGDFAIQTGNPAAPLVSTSTVVSDANGLAQVVIKAAANAFTQPALIRATEVTTGNQVTGQYTIVQTTNGALVLSVVPATATITSASTTSCTAGFRVDYFIYGGTPPYRVTSTFPDGATLINSIVTTSGGYFEAITNGTCVNPLVFSIFDAVGLQTTASLQNLVGTASGTAPAAPVAISPPSISTTGANPCTGTTYPFIITGGTPPFSVAVSGGGTATPNPVTTSPGSVNVSNLLTGSGLHTIFVGDASTPQLTTTATITCN
jgi:hypothetical protein